MDAAEAGQAVETAVGIDVGLSTFAALSDETKVDNPRHLRGNPHNPDLLELSDLPHPMLEKLIQLLLLDSYLWTTINEEKEIKSYPIYPLHLYHEKGLWLIEGFDLKDEKRRIFPVDNLTDVKSYPTKKRLSKKMILEKLSKQEEAINLVLELGPKASSFFLEGISRSGMCQK